MTSWACVDCYVFMVNGDLPEDDDGRAGVVRDSVAGLPLFSTGRYHGVDGCGHDHEDDFGGFGARLKPEGDRAKPVEGGIRPSRTRRVAHEEHALTAGAAQNEPALDGVGYDQDALGAVHVVPHPTEMPVGQEGFQSGIGAFHEGLRFDAPVGLSAGQGHERQHQGAHKDRECFGHDSLLSLMGRTYT